MPRRVGSSFLLALTAAVAVVAACSSKQADTTCIDIELTSDELTCTTDADCALVTTGQVCPGYVPQTGDEFGTGTLCDNAAANSVGVTKVAAQLASVPTGTATAGQYCDAIPGTPKCLGGQCGVCNSLAGNGLPPYSEPACSDAGVAADGG